MAEMHPGTEMINGSEIENVMRLAHRGREISKGEKLAIPHGEQLLLLLLEGDRWR